MHHDGSLCNIYRKIKTFWWYVKGWREIWRYISEIPTIILTENVICTHTQVAKEVFDEEVAGHRAELDMMNTTIKKHPSMSKQISINAVSSKTDENLNISASTHSKPVSDSPGSSHEVTRRVSARSKTVTAMAAERRVSQFHHTLHHHNQDHLFAKLADKEHQLVSAKQELVETRNLVQDMENELEKLKRENAELVKLQGMCIRGSCIRVVYSTFESKRHILKFLRFTVNFRDKCCSH